jgi:hypothetical protein
MIRMMSTAGQAMALPEAANWNARRPNYRRDASLPPRLKVHDTITIPTRGILMGTLLSSCLWAGLIICGHALWLYLR